MGASTANGVVAEARRSIDLLRGAVIRAMSASRRQWRNLSRNLRRGLSRRKCAVGRSAVRTLGAGGERIAERHLQHDGYRPMLRNARLAGVEVDLVMLAPDDHTVVIVEVKTRSRTDVERAMPRADQRRRLRRAAAALRRRWPGRPVRGDVVLVLRDGDAVRIEHRAGEIVLDRGAARPEITADR